MSVIPSSKRVSLSLRAAKELRRPYPDSWVTRELERAIAGAESPKEKAAKKARTRGANSKREAKKVHRAGVYALVDARAAGHCESCGAHAMAFMQPLEHDHFWGRAREESVESVWLVCHRCHRDKTENRPNAEFWLARFSDHCDRHGYARQAKKAESRLAVLEAKSGLPFSTEREP